MINLNGPGLKLKDEDLPRIGKTMLNCGEDEIHAVLEVETSGHGFDSRGRPIILFEPHVFYRSLSGDKRQAAVMSGLAYAKWGERPYPRDSYPRLLEALKIDESAALMSCSWGMGQILGENYKLAGYASVQAMVTDMTAGEAEQLIAMASFIRANRLDAALRAHDWAKFARGYNGASYAKNHYDTRLATAFAKWQRIPDTPWRADAADESTSNPPAAPASTPSHEIPITTSEVAAPKSSTSKQVATGLGIGAATVALFHDHPVIILICFVIIALVTAAVILRRK